MTSDILGAVSSLLFILALLGVFAWAVKRFGLVPGQPKVKQGQKHIEIIENRMLDGRNRLIVIRWKGHEYLVSSNPAGVTLLGKEKSDFGALLDEKE